MCSKPLFDQVTTAKARTGQDCSSVPLLRLAQHFAVEYAEVSPQAYRPRLIELETVSPYKEHVGAKLSNSGQAVFLCAPSATRLSVSKGW